METVEETAKTFRSYFQHHDFELVLEDFEVLKQKLSDARYIEENLPAQIEIRTDQISEETEKIYNEGVNHFQFLKYLTNMNIELKKSKDNFLKRINILNDGISCTRHCAKSIRNSAEEENAALIVGIFTKVTIASTD